MLFYQVTGSDTSTLRPNVSSLLTALKNKATKSKVSKRAKHTLITVLTAAIVIFVVFKECGPLLELLRIGDLHA